MLENINPYKVLIRTGLLNDAKIILDIQQVVISENEFMITVSEEFNKSIDQQRKWIQKIIDNERETIIVAELNGIVVGWLVLQSQNRKRLYHTGSLGMMIHKDFRELGIGKMLINELLHWAELNPLIEKVCLGVLSTNLRAIALYKSMGFVEEGRKVKAIKLNANKYVDDILMYKMV
ncbi:GNAT family N-acetyltransferase [Bacillus sp. FSL K6-3431]|uniref:GNAT family N-acetyltransferase n=1 Tax=Bacillus sp. FSL K6-3431 TaxID=2921500 RepID=UPI0030F6C819